MNLKAYGSLKEVLVPLRYKLRPNAALVLRSISEWLATADAKNEASPLHVLRARASHVTCRSCRWKAVALVLLFEILYVLLQCAARS